MRLESTPGGDAVRVNTGHREKNIKRGATDYIIKNRLHRLVPAIHRALSEAEIRREHLGAAEALRASEERFKVAARATNDVIWEWDLASDEIWCSETFERSASCC